MTVSDGDVDEMPVSPLDDRALEALLNGGPPAQSGLDWLLPFVEDLDRAAQEPAPVVRPALALLLKEGFSPGSGTVPAATGPAPAAMPPAPSTERVVVRPVLRGAVARFAGVLRRRLRPGAGMTPTHEMLAAVQSWMRHPWSPAVWARLERAEAYLIRRMTRDD